MISETPIKNLILPEEHIRIRKIRATETFLLAKVAKLDNVVKLVTVLKSP